VSVRPISHAHKAAATRDPEATYEPEVIGGGYCVSPRDGRWLALAVALAFMFLSGALIRMLGL
jgi:hypothetical protein